MRSDLVNRLKVGKTAVFKLGKGGGMNEPLWVEGSKSFSSAAFCVIAAKSM